MRKASMRWIGVFLLGIGFVAASPAQSSRTIFRGRPVVKIEETGTERTASPISGAAAAAAEVVISQIGDRYYLASRENEPLTRLDSGAAYITYQFSRGGGYVRVIKPEWKERLNQPLNPLRSDFDYMEHVLIGLRTITYFGHETTPIRP